MLQKLLLLIATFFNVGKISKAPGTMGTLATIPLWWALWHAGPFLYMTVTILLIPIGAMAAQAYVKHSNTHDAQEIVIDEVVGFLITMVWLPLTWQSLVIGFIVFRFLDIVKPPPIRQLDRTIKGGIGVMIDDIAAGLIGSLLMQFLYSHTNWLGSQIISVAPSTPLF
ncbi:MAG: phosphatidylglycerophosphatase A [Bdellovibrionaceae bacterium]|nr:phosphatidylglycerophosphatase A [Bdellovibrio sp.]